MASLVFNFLHLIVNLDREFYLVTNFKFFSLLLIVHFVCLVLIHFVAVVVVSEINLFDLI